MQHEVVVVTFVIYLVLNINVDIWYRKSYCFTSILSTLHCFILSRDSCAHIYIYIYIYMFVSPNLTSQFYFCSVNIFIDCHTE